MEVKEIKFYDDTLLGVRTEDGKVWLAVRKTIIDIGLTENQADNEVKKVKSSLLLANQWKDLSVKYDGQVRKIKVLSERFVPMWLAQINLTPSMKKNNPEAVKKLLKYQLEAADVLHNAFLGTEEKAKNFYGNLGLIGVIKNLETVLNTQKIQNVQINNIETMIEEQQEQLEKVLDRMTLDHKEQQKIHQAGKDRINFLLGGAHSKLYKEKARMYFINMWLNFCECFKCATYKDLNPKYFKKAMKFIGNWEYRSSKKKN